jgi:hypothetical protein
MKLNNETIGIGLIVTGILIAIFFGVPMIVSYMHDSAPEPAPISKDLAFANEMLDITKGSDFKNMVAAFRAGNSAMAKPYVSRVRLEFMQTTMPTDPNLKSARALYISALEKAKANDISGATRDLQDANLNIEIATNNL